MVSNIPFGSYHPKWTGYLTTYSSIFGWNFRKVWKVTLPFTFYPKFPKFSVKSGGAYHLTEKSGWGIESIMVSDLPVYRRIAISVTVWIQKRGEFVQRATSTPSSLAQSLYWTIRVIQPRTVASMRQDEAVASS